MPQRVFGKKVMVRKFCHKVRAVWRKGGQDLVRSGRGALPECWWHSTVSRSLGNFNDTADFLRKPLWRVASHWRRRAGGRSRVDRLAAGAGDCRRKGAERGLPLSELETKLPASRFIHSHRSYLVQLRWLQSVDLQSMTIQVKDKRVPLSKGYREQLLERLDQISPLNTTAFSPPRDHVWRAIRGLRDVPSRTSPCNALPRPTQIFRPLPVRIWGCSSNRRGPARCR